MAIEDHPKYDDWSKALDKLKAATDALQDAARSKIAVSAARARLAGAQAHYNMISDQIDEDDA